MTLHDLRGLRPGDQVIWRAPGLIPPIDGEVIASDRRSVEIHLDDGTSMILWLIHAEQRRDSRHQQLFRRPLSRPQPTTTEG